MRTINFIVASFFILMNVVAPVAFAKESHLVLKAKMVSVAAFDTNEIVDALDHDSANGAIPTATVVFKINSVMKGALPLQKAPGSASLGSQMKDSVKDKNILQIITMDYENPEVEHEDKPRWFAVGVQSPLETFKVLSWNDLPKESYRLVFSKAENSGWLLEAATTD